MFVSAEDGSGAASSVLFKGLLSDVGAAVLMAEVMVVAIAGARAGNGRPQDSIQLRARYNNVRALRGAIKASAGDRHGVWRSPMAK